MLVLHHDQISCIVSNSQKFPIFGKFNAGYFFFVALKKINDFAFQDEAFVRLVGEVVEKKAFGSRTPPLRWRMLPSLEPVLLFSNQTQTVDYGKPHKTHVLE
jgi:hypothetical protein